MTPQGRIPGSQDPGNRKEPKCSAVLIHMSQSGLSSSTQGFWGLSSSAFQGLSPYGAFGSHPGEQFSIPLIHCAPPHLPPSLTSVWNTLWLSSARRKSLPRLKIKLNAGKPSSSHSPKGTWPQASCQYVTVSRWSMPYLLVCDVPLLICAPLTRDWEYIGHPVEF